MKKYKSFPAPERTTSYPGPLATDRLGDRDNSFHMTYKEKLKDERWQKRRLEIIERDGETCQRCGSGKNLQVHHLVYKSGVNPWDYFSEELITLCEHCHEYETQNYTRAMDRLVYNISTSGLLTDEVNALAYTHINQKSMGARD